MQLTSQVYPGAFDTMLNGRMEEIRASLQQQAVTNPPKPYGPVHKAKGELTEKQQRFNDDMGHASRVVTQNAKAAFSESLPPPPTGKEMVRTYDSGHAVARKIYEDNPVKQVPFSSKLVGAYKQIDAEGDLFTAQIHLHQLYA